MGILKRNIGPIANFFPPKKRPMANVPDVVLVQGFFTSPRSLESMVQHLEAQGQSCSIPSLGGLRGLWQTGRVARAGAALATYVRGLPSDARPWLIGHSIGGMIARHAVQFGDIGDRIGGLLTIGAPHRGTSSAAVGLVLGLGLLSRAPMDITPFSGLVRRMNRAPWPTDLPLVSIVSRSDMLCRPRAGNARAEGATMVRNIVLEKLGHTELVRTDWVLDAIVRLMQDPNAPFHTAA